MLSHPRLPAAAFLAAALSAATAAPAAAAGFNIELDFSTSTDATSDQILAFTMAGEFWSSVITGYSDAAAGAFIGDLETAVTIAYDDGPGGTLASAGPTTVLTGADYVYAASGVMNFDSADIDGWSFDQTLAIAIHEMAHVIGFGILWNINDVYTFNSGEYVGAEALSWYQTLYDPAATYVPVELGGGSGTANGHWDEAWAAGVYALMTGYIHLPWELTYVSLASFSDIGYEVVSYEVFQDELADLRTEAFLASVPLPPAAAALLAGLIPFAAHARRARGA